jgi:hypothetical protein
MKTRFLFLLSFSATTLLTSFSTTQASASDARPTVSVQVDNPFAFFRTHRQGKGVTASWAVQPAEDIVCFTIQRTYEDPTDPYANWEDVNVTICNSSRSFTYTDKTVFPGTINYRVVALHSDGSTEASEISSVRIPSR